VLAGTVYWRVADSVPGFQGSSSSWKVQWIELSEMLRQLGYLESSFFDNDEKT